MPRMMIFNFTVRAMDFMTGKHIVYHACILTPFTSHFPLALTILLNTAPATFAPAAFDPYSFAALLAIFAKPPVFFVRPSLATCALPFFVLGMVFMCRVKRIMY